MVMRHFRGLTDSFDSGGDSYTENMNAPGLGREETSLLPIPLLSSDSFVLLISFSVAEITRFLDKVQQGTFKYVWLH